MDLTPYCAGTGHVTASCGQENHGLAGGTVTVTWCLVCGQRDPERDS